MAKRFTDNEKWKDAWFMDLPAKYKLFWLYLLDECNHAGVWKVNFKVASFYIGEHLEYSEVKRFLKDRITLLNDEYWYINKFIKYQYKCEIEALNISNKAHLSVVKILDEYDFFKPLTSPLLGVKDKDKDLYKDGSSDSDEKPQDEKPKGDKPLNTEYTEKDFLTNWSTCRKKFMNKPTHIPKLDTFELVNFNKALKDFTKEEINTALVGLFKQENKEISSMWLKPKHFLENISKYLNAEISKDYSLYGKSQTNNKTGAL